MRDGAHDAIGGSTQRLTRRQALKLGGLAGLGVALLSACAPQTPAPAKPAESKPTEAKPAAQPTAAQAAPGPALQGSSKPAEQAKPAAGTPKTGGTFRAHMWTEDPPTLDPHLN